MVLQVNGIRTPRGYAQIRTEISEKFPQSLYDWQSGLIEINIGLKEWYRNPPSDTFLFFNSERKDVCPMRGSISCIASMSGDSRVYAYDYLMASKWGLWVARRYKRNGERIIRIRANNPARFLHGYDHIKKNNFNHEFKEEVYETGDDRKWYSDRDFDECAICVQEVENTNQRDYRFYDKEGFVYSDVFIVICHDLDRDKKNTLIKLVKELAQADLDEKVSIKLAA